MNLKRKMRNFYSMKIEEVVLPHYPFFVDETVGKNELNLFQSRLIQFAFYSVVVFILIAYPIGGLNYSSPLETVLVNSGKSDIIKSGIENGLNNFMEIVKKSNITEKGEKE